MSVISLHTKAFKIPTTSQKVGELNDIEDAICDELELSADQQFLVAVREKAEKCGCRFLFELPGGIIDERAKHAAAILCPNGSNYHLVFLIHLESENTISIVESSDVSPAIVDFAWSFTRIASLLSQPSAKVMQ